MTRTQRNNLTEGSVWKKLLGFFFPIALGMLFQQLYNTADTVIVGRWVGDDALAAVGGSANSLTNLIIGFFTGLNTGATVLISQKAGSGDDEGLSKVLHTALLFCAGVGLLVTVGGYFLTPWAMRMLQTPEEILADSTQYLRIYFVGAIPLLTYNLLQGTLQGLGDSRRPLKYLIISCLLNIGLDLLFVAKLHWGIAGAGWASVISMVVCMAMCVLHLLRSNGPAALHLHKLKVHPLLFKKMMRIGIPAGIQGMMYSISNILVQASVNKFGTATVTAWTSSSKLDGFYWVTISAFGVAICAFVGQCYGAGKIERLKQSIRVCLLIALGTTFVLSAALLFVAKYAYSLFLTNPDTISLTISIMWCFVPFYFLWTFIEILSGVFRGVGDTLRPMIIVMLGTCLFRILWLIFVLPHWNSIYCVSWLYTISWTITALAFIIYYYKANWLKYQKDL